MYRRFLNNDDYLGIITPEALAQLTRGNDARHRPCRVGHSHRAKSSHTNDT